MKKQHTIRSFPGRCRRCGNPVFYWEGSSGSKVFFDYPVKGRLIKHTCYFKKNENQKSFNKSNSLLRNDEHSVINLDRNTYTCPVCGKLFKNEKSLSSHIKELEKTEQAHIIFFENTSNFFTNNNSYKKTIYDTLVKEDYMDNKYGVIFKHKNKRQK